MTNRVHVIAIVTSVCFMVASEHSSADDPAHATSRLSLKRGEQTLLNLAVDSQLVVSRRGVVDLKPLPDGVWQVTALQSGLVMIKERSQRGEERSEFILEVVHPDVDRAPLNHELPDFICREPGITCDEKRRRVSGKTASFIWLWAAEEVCVSAKPCVFAASLSSQGRARLARYWQELVPEAGVQAYGNGRAVVEAYCGEKAKELRQQLDAFSSGGVAKQRVQLSCLEPPLVVRAKAFFLKKQDAEDVGLSYSFGFNNHGLKVTPALDAFLSKNESQVVGMPAVRLQGGKEALVHSGTELKSSGTRDIPESWRKLGLMLKLKAYPVSAVAAQVAYEMELTQPSGGSSERSLQASTLKSEVTLRRNEPKIVGEMDVEAFDTSLRRLPWLGAVPLIGPFFKAFEEGVAKSRLFLALVLLPDEGSEGLPRFFTAPERAANGGKE